MIIYPDFSQVDSPTTFSCRIFGLSHHLTSDTPRPLYHATQTLYPVRTTSLAHGPLRLTYTDIAEYNKTFKPPLQDDFVTVKQVSFDAELYINSVVPEYADLAERYLSLRDYDMRLVDVCEKSNTVLILIMVLCLGHHDTHKHKQVLISSGFLLSWSVETGLADTLEFLPIEEFCDNPCSRVKRWCKGPQTALQLRKKWYVPTTYHQSVRAFSNASVFSGVSLTKLQHPYLPVAIIL